MNTLAVLMLLLWGPGPMETSDEQARADTARSHYRANRFATAAQEFEALWQEYKVPKYLYNAGLAHEGLGHDARAILDWQRFLDQLEISAEERRKAQGKLAAALERTTPVSLRLGPEDGLMGAILRIQRDDGDPRPVEIAVSELRDGEGGEKLLQLEAAKWRISLNPSELRNAAFAGVEAMVTIIRGQAGAMVELKLREKPASSLTIELSPRRARQAGATFSLHGDGGEALAPLHLRDAESTTRIRMGRWKYQVLAPGFAAKRGEIELTGAQTLKVRLVRELSAEEILDRRWRIGFGVGFGLTSMGAAVGGAYLLTSGEARFKAFDVDDEINRYPREDTFVVSDRSAGGAGALGASLGLAIGAVTGGIRPVARPAWITQLVVGSAMLVAGGSWCITTTEKWTGRYTQKDMYLDTTETEKFHKPILISAALAGLGAGLLPGAVAGLIVSRKAREKKGRSYAIQPVRSPGSIGLQIVGAF